MLPPLHTTKMYNLNSTYAYNKILLKQKNSHQKQTAFKKQTRFRCFFSLKKNISIDIFVSLSYDYFKLTGQIYKLEIW